MTLPVTQLPTVRLLERLAGASPLETPISAVFVGAETVWKLRKAVRLSFLDFTTLAERERTARREFELNAPNAPGLYLDVVPVTRTEGSLELDGAGEAVDWVVRMARVPQPDFLDAVAERGDLSATLLDQLGDTVAAMHQRLSASDRDPVASLDSTLAGNRISGHHAGLPARRLDDWYKAARAHFDHLAPWLTTRGKAGFVRRAHGDLHLRNMCLWRGKPVAFDAMEFSETMATVDIGYDLAFLLMDLDILAGRPAANRVMNRYIARTGDVALLIGMPLFLSMRALVRAHVTCHGGGHWEDYLAYAEAVLQPAPAVVVGIGGLPGTGKSTLARALAPTLGRPPGALILRSDEIRKRQAGVTPEEHLPKAAYAEAVSQEMKAELFAGVTEAGQAGHAVIADMTFMDPLDRAALRQASGDTRCIGVWLQAPLSVLESRVLARTGDASDADLAVLRRAAAAHPGAGDWQTVDTAVSTANALAILRGHVTKQNGP